MAESLEFALHPEAETVYYAALVKALIDIQGLIRQVDYAVSREKRGRPWRVVALHNPIPTVTLEPAVDGAAVVDTLAQGLRVVTTGDTANLPTEFNEMVLSDLRGMGRLFKGTDRLSRVIVRSQGEEVAVIDRTTPHRIEVLERSGYSALGSIEGTLDAINVHGNRSFTIWDRVTGVGIRCSIPRGESWKQRVISLLERRVLVRGLIRYLRDGRPFSITEVTDIIDRTPDPSWPKATFGSIPDLTGGLDSVEYLSAIRG